MKNYMRIRPSFNPNRVQLTRTILNILIIVLLYAIIAIAIYGYWRRINPSIGKEEHEREKKIVTRHKTVPPVVWKRNDVMTQFVEVSAAAEQLPRNGSLFCWVMTSSRYHKVRALAVNQTWLPRCDHGQIFTNGHFTEPAIPYSTVFAGITDKYEYLFYKTIFALHYIYEHISPDFDWYYKADDDTYVVVEHLRKYLSTLDPNKPYYLGMRMRPDLPNGYNSGGAGYVLSRAAMKIFNEKLYANETLCPDHIYEDLGIGRCLASVGIFPIDTRNGRGQQRFNAYRPEDMYHGKISNKWIYDPQVLGFDSMGEDLISYHHLNQDEMRIFDQLLYRVKTPKLIEPTVGSLMSKLLF